MMKLEHCIVVIPHEKKQKQIQSALFYCLQCHIKYEVKILFLSLAVFPNHLSPYKSFLFPHPQKKIIENVHFTFLFYAASPDSM